ncbi:MAG: PhnA domain-containing protein [Lentisphaeraceae bacterium]|nr:PhnA domain-containing protein [Lentisphaeraceae bacterium]
MARGRDEHEARKMEVSSFGKDLARRCKSHCELCGENTSLEIFEVPPVGEPNIEKCVMICEPCRVQVQEPKAMDVNHWHCLNDAAWSEEPAIQVLAWRLLTRLKDHAWAEDLLEQMYLDEEIQAWAESDAEKVKGGDDESYAVAKTFDSNGVELFAGDTVTIIKDLDVKGAQFTAKRGTIVKGVYLTNNPEHIEGRVNKTRIVLKTCFLRKVQ